MMRQYLTVKAQYPEAIVLFRMGDFFETFYDDAEECARLVDLTLTKRSKEKNAAPMAGVPHHAVDNYIARLVELGRRVVMVDQVEDPKKAKGLVRREITRVISPGTYVNQNSSGRQPTYLVALSVRSKRKKSVPWGLAVLDVSTGEFRATSGEDINLAVEEVARLEAKELLVTEGLAHDHIARLAPQRLENVTLTPLDDGEYKSSNVREVLERGIGPDELTAAEKLLPAVSVDAAAIVLKYAEETQLRSESFERQKGGHFGHINQLQPYLPGDALLLDTQARRHLELFRTSTGHRSEGSLMQIIDCAVTSMGGRLIGRWLSRPSTSAQTINRRLNAVQSLIETPSMLDEIRGCLKSVYDLERLLGRIVMARANPKDLAALRETLRRVPDVLSHAASCRVGQDSVWSDIDENRLNQLAKVDDCRDVFEKLVKAIVDVPPIDFGKERIFVEGYDIELDGYVKLATEGKKVLDEIEERERERTGISSLKIKFNRVFGYFIEVTKANLSLVPDDYVRKQTTVNSERYFTAELKEYEEKVLSANEQRRVRANTLFDQLIEELFVEAKRLKDLANTLSEIDGLSAFAHIAQRDAWTRPVVDHEDRIEIVAGRHPVLEARSFELGERFVPNDIRLDKDEQMLIVTGPNMAGKSTIMRQTALLVILAQMGAFVPAQSAKIGIVDRVFTRVGASDDLSQGQSTFMVEMTETARILRSATSRSLIILDEIGRGTSTYDGLSIAWAVAEYIHDHLRAKTLFATHYHELTEICREKENARNYHVAVKQFDEEIVFLRKLVDGPTNRSYGVQVARLAGLPKRVLQRARIVLSKLEEQDHSVNVARQNQMSLFVPAKDDGLSVETMEVLDALKALDVDDITPRQALAQIAEWQSAMKNKPS